LSLEYHNLVVVGAGPGGLVFARVLQKAGLDVAVFEREVSRDGRTQGGTLDLHVESGQWALEQAGLSNEFRAIARPEGQDLRIANKHGKLLWNEISEPDVMSRPEVDRPRLRKILLDSLAPGTIRWNYNLSSVKPADGEAGHILHFENSNSIRAGMLVGADGAWSRVRPLVSDAKPAYTGVSFIETGISDVATRHPEVSAIVGRGSFFALEDDKGLMAQKNGDGSVRISAAFRIPEDGFAALRIGSTDPAATRSAILAQFEDWNAEITSLIRACDNIFVPRPLTALPVGIRWPSQLNVTLIGDAAHLMSPFAGAGANLAMQDGAALALEIREASDPSVAIAAYEEKMFERAEEEAQRSADGLAMCISPNGSERFANWMERVQALHSAPHAT
jgi:2-polyprenyl-6-methoxyphenol hydroxylase-like FAD-dependent oxidoreductase